MNFSSTLAVQALAATCLGLLSCAMWTRAENLEDKTPGGLKDPNQIFFVTEIFNKYGNNNSITYEGFEHLLENLGLGKLRFDTNHDVSMHKINGTFLEFHDKLSLHKHNHSLPQFDKEQPVDHANREKRNLPGDEIAGGNQVEKNLKRKCLTVQDILSAYGLQPYHEVVISPPTYLQICPAIVYELDQKLCQQEEQQAVQRKQEDYRLVWLYASISILIMGVSGILCIAVVPLARKNYFKSLLQFLVSLGAGTLCGDALIHLIPQVFSKSTKMESDSTLLLKGVVVLMAIYIFYVIESLIKLIEKQKRKSLESIKESGKMLPKNGFESHGHGHSHGIKAVAWMAILGDILHNLTDGLSIGAAFGSSLSSGIASSIAIFCHELPHELGDYAILLSSGMSVKKSLFYNLLSTLFSFLGMSAGVLLGEIEDSSLWINAFTAGSFLYVALSDLVPELRIMESKAGSTNFLIQTFGLSCGGILMFAIALYEDKIERFLGF